MRTQFLVLSSVVLAVIALNCSSAQADDDAIKQWGSIAAVGSANEESARSLDNCNRGGIVVRQWRLVRAPGARVMEVDPDGPSASHLKLGDYILFAVYKVKGKYEENFIGYGDDFTPMCKACQDADPGPFTMIVARNGKLVTAQIKLK